MYWQTLCKISLLSYFFCNTAYGFAPKCTANITPKDNIQHALDTLPAHQNPAVLCFAKGKYLVSSFIHIDHNNVILRGKGPSTILQLQPKLEQPLIVVGDFQHQEPAQAISGIGIENMHLIGDKSVEHEFMPEHPYLSNSVIVVRNGHNIRMEGLNVEQCRSACLLSEYDSSDILIKNNDVAEAAWDGVSFNRSGKISLIHNTIHDNAAAGITTEHLVDSFITDNTISNNKSSGIYLSDSTNNRITNNLIKNNTISGILFTCAIRQRTPEVLCWDNSVSQNNRVENNRFVGNPHSYTLGVDRAARCNYPGFIKNFWRYNRSDSTGLFPPVQEYGVCVDSDEKQTPAPNTPDK